MKMLQLIGYYGSSKYTNRVGRQHALSYCDGYMSSRTGEYKKSETDKESKSMTRRWLYSKGRVA